MFFLPINLNHWQMNRIILVKSWLNKLNRLNLIRRELSTKEHAIIKVLGIESTCDDTCAAVVTSQREILSDARSSQSTLHVNRGGILPVTARERHSINLNAVVRQALDQANLTMDDIDAVAVAYKPGLILSLTLGVDYAKRLCLKYQKPLIGIHHMEAHAVTAHLNNPDIGFPFLALLISGGHTMMTLTKDIDEHYILSESNASPVGECLDKLARALKIRNLGPPFNGFSGGQAIEVLARSGDPNRFTCSNVAGSSQNFNFSVNDLRNQWDSQIKHLQKKYTDFPVDSPIPEVADLAAGIQKSIVLHLAPRIHRIVKYLEATDLVNLVNKENHAQLNRETLPMRVDYCNPRPLNLKLVVSGGVACNMYIVSKLKEYCDKMSTFYDDTKIEVIAPSPRHLCTDNGVMIAWNGVLKLILKNNDHDDILLRNEEQIMSLEAQYDAQLGVDIRRLIDTNSIVIKHLKI